MEKTHCRLFKDFDTAYETLISAIVKKDQKAACAAYTDWLSKREACKQIVVDSEKQGDLKRLQAVSAAVEDAFESLDDGVNALIKFYKKYQDSRKQALEILCPKNPILEAIDLKPGMGGVGIDLKKLLGIP